MNALGRWKVTLSTQMGPQVMQLRITTQDHKFTGRVESPMGTEDVAGVVSGSALSWTMTVTQPISMSITFAVRIEGERMSGTAKLGPFGNVPVSGERAGDEAGAPPESSASSAKRYDTPYVDVNELRNEPVPHRYVHGGFRGTDARFSFYFPPREQYQGRFFQNTYPLATSEDIGPFPIQFDVAIGNLGFTIDSGAYYVQTNMGGADRTPPADPAIGAYRVNAAAASYSRVVATELYGEHRPYGYLFGGSGGSYQVMGAAENSVGVWDGFLPYVLGTPNAIPSMFTVRMHALRVLRLRNRFPSIVDALDPGGSGDPYAALNDEERAALQEATLLGYPLRGWWNHESLDSGYFSFVAPLVPMLDPSYAEDFWSKPGYLGSDPDASIRAARFQFDTHVAAVIEGFPRRIELAGVPDRDFADSHLIVKSGEALGKSIPIAAIDGRTLAFTLAADHAALRSIAPGDEVQIDNSWVLALQTYQRHQVPSPDMYGWDQYRGADGKPIYPQRDVLVGPIATTANAGSLPTGHIRGKMLVLEVMMDIDALPWQADWYRARIKKALGGNFADNFALWFIDHAQHDDPASPAAHAHTVSYAGALQQGLRDLSRWVESGVKPLETRYEIGDSQVKLPRGAAMRRGIQPVVELTANGGARAAAMVDEPVRFDARIEVPPGAGAVVDAEWDFEGVGNYAGAERLESSQSRVQLTAVHRYAKPGVYFPVLRATSQRQGDAKTPYGRIQNIARARVVVTGAA